MSLAQRLQAQAGHHLFRLPRRLCIRNPGRQDLLGNRIGEELIVVVLGEVGVPIGVSGAHQKMRRTLPDDMSGMHAIELGCGTA